MEPLPLSRSLLLWLLGNFTLLLLFIRLTLLLLFLRVFTELVLLSIITLLFVLRSSVLLTPSNTFTELLTSRIRSTLLGLLLSMPGLLFPLKASALSLYSSTLLAVMTDRLFCLNRPTTEGRSGLSCGRRFRSQISLHQMKNTTQTLLRRATWNPNVSFCGLNCVRTRQCFFSLF